MAETKTENGKLKTVLVTGDFIKDFNIVKQPVTITGYRDNLPLTVLGDEGGGAWYMAELIEQMNVLNKIELLVSKYEDFRNSADVVLNRSFQVWAKLPDKNDKKKLIWRIDNFLGCEQGQCNNALYAVPDDKKGLIDIIVIDDLSLGFVNEECLFTNLLPEFEKAKSIIYKTHSPIYNSKLWLELKNKNLLKKVTVVTTADSLREGGAYITKGFSWDKTLEETVKELKNGRYSIIFSECRRVVILFDKMGIGSFTTESLKFNGADATENKLVFEKFVYSTNTYEGYYASRYNGFIYGNLSMLASAIVLLDIEANISLSYIFKLALDSLKLSLELGGGSKKELNFSERIEKLKVGFSHHRKESPKNEKDLTKEQKELLAKEKEILKFFNGNYSTAFPRYSAGSMYGLSNDENEWKSDLLRDYVGEGEYFTYSKSFEIIMKGAEAALAPVPMAKFGKYLTFDRDEIERIHSIQNAINTYVNHPSDNRPLSFAVFGAPGCGKSFAIKQLLEYIFHSSSKPETFNLTQFKDDYDLIKALHIVRDKTVKGSMPLIFWDEFDTNHYRWLKDFLAPMQDGEFTDGTTVHPLGRAIFIFAGGVCQSFKEFAAKALNKKDEKCPDFISRLRGFVDIKGPNKSGDDKIYMIRRATLIHDLLRIHHPQIFEKNAFPSISPGVINALLKLEKYEHGARSVESIISLSRTENKKFLDSSSLPSIELIRIHASEKFFDLVHEGELEYPLIEIIAETLHNHWKEEKEKPFIDNERKEQHYILGEPRIDGPDVYQHPRLMEYNKLKDEWKDDNRITARLTKAKFAMVGYDLIPPHNQNSSDIEIETVVDELKVGLINIEHDIWVRSHLFSGYEYSENTNDKVLVHKDMAFLDKISDSKEINLDKAIINATVTVLKAHGYKLRKIIPHDLTADVNEIFNLK
ncbi:MAG: hypothetical protein V1720_18890 [bacterium]